jgi:hypothetical protein
MALLAAIGDEHDDTCTLVQAMTNICNRIANLFDPQ